MLRPVCVIFNVILMCAVAAAQESEQPVKPQDPAAESAEIVLEQKADRVSVTIDGELFTEYIFAGYEKPILYPVIGPYGIRMTRDYPMRQDNPDEKQDHPHHKSIWFGHMEVGGESFWHSGESAGTTVQDSIRIEGNSILCTNRLIGKQGGVVATDSRKISFAAQGPLRFIDYEVTYHASEGRVQFGDNKDGQMGIRMNPRLRLSGPVATGKAINAEGVREQEIWGKRSPWIDYWGEVDGHTVGIAMFDHPTNFRHPTWWHAREYGLLSANPFGIHHFEESNDAHLGDHLLLKGESLTFKHRFVFHPGDYQQAHIAELYKQWAKQE